MEVFLVLFLQKKNGLPQCSGFIAEMHSASLLSSISGLNGFSQAIQCGRSGGMAWSP
jgi:hypothetical protein